MLSLSDDDVDFADNDNDNGYDGSDILHRPEHRPSLRRAHGEKAIKRSKNVTKSLQCVSLFASIGAPSWFQLIKRRFENSTASNRILFSWWKLL